MSLFDLTAAELAEVRTEFDAAVLPDRADVRRQAAGAWTTHLEALECRIGVAGMADPVTRSEVGGGTATTLAVRVPAGADVKRGDTLHVPSYPGRRLEVVEVAPVTRIHRTLLCRVEGP
jgi:hypothetical protein